VDRERSVRLVNEALSREYNSVSAYVLHSSPYTVPEDGPALKAFEEIQVLQDQTARWLVTKLREDFGAGPTVRAFEYWQRDLNYLSVPYLVRFAVEHFEATAGGYEAILKEASGDPALTAIFARLRDEAKAHGARLVKFLPKWTEHPKEGPPAAEPPVPPRQRKF
jgi:hypothetical protein